VSNQQNTALEKNMSGALAVAGILEGVGGSTGLRILANVFFDYLFLL
jgi:hypothetical protein